jgi:hypothetical protein
MDSRLFTSEVFIYSFMLSCCVEKFPSLRD